MNFAFNTAQVIWMLTFAAQLVLLVVLLGRDRARLYPVFTICSVLAAFRWLASRLLFQRMSPIAGNVAFLSLAVLVAVVNLAMLIEIALKTYSEVPKKPRLIGAGVVVVLALATVILWGPWPAWKTFAGGGLIATLRMMQLASQRFDMLTGALSVQLAILAAIVGARVGAGWRNQRQQLLMGIGAIGLCQLTISAVWQYIATHAQPHSQEEYFKVLGIRDRLNNINSGVYIVVLVWWILALWADASTEPEASALVAETGTVEAEPALIENEAPLSALKPTEKPAEE